MLDKLFELIKSEKEELPNRFSFGMGERIRKARLDAKMSQAELAERAYFRQASISQIEAGKRSVSAVEVLYLSAALNKPIIYFYPLEYFGFKADEDQHLSLLEQELLMQTRRLSNDDLRKLIAQARALADLDG